MNIFVLDNLPSNAARSYVDRHVGAGILELTQMLSTAHIMLDGHAAAEARVTIVERPTHVNHPCVKWVRDSRHNYQWAAALAWHLVQQFTLRFQRGHEYARIISDLQRFQPLNIPLVESTVFVQSMPSGYRRSSPIEAYRNYYFQTRKHLADWTVVGKPTWWMELEQRQEKACG